LIGYGNQQTSQWNPRRKMMPKLTVRKVDLAVRKLKAKYKAKGKTDDWLHSWERGFRKVYDTPQAK